MNIDEQKPVQQDTVTQPQHDQFFRSAFSEPALFRHFLIWLVPLLAELLDLDRMECEKDSFIDEQLKAHYSDVIYKIPLRGTNENVVVFVLLEHKTSSEHFTMLQVLRYIILIWLREYNSAKKQGRLADFMLPPVLPIIVYHGERKFNAPIRLGKLIRPIKGFERYMLDFEGIVLDLTLTDENDLPEDLELNCVLAVMQAVFRKDVADRIVRIFQKMKPKLHIPHYRERWIKLLRYMLSSSKYLTEEEMMEVKNQMSDTDEVLTISPFAQTLLARGFAQGREEGHEEGRERMVETLLRILTKNLGEVPPTLRGRLHTIHDLNVLGQLTDIALDCQSLAEFEQVLNQ